MFGQNPIHTPLSLGRIVGGLSKTLGVINQVIPIYKEAKPMINNAKTAFSLIKEFGNNATTRVMDNKNKNITPVKETIEKIKNTNIEENKKGPTFFL